MKGVTCDGFPFNENTATSNIHVLCLNVLLMLVIIRFAMNLSCLNHLLDCTVNLPAFSWVSLNVVETLKSFPMYPHVIHCPSSRGLREALGLPSQWTWGTGSGR